MSFLTKLIGDPAQRTIRQLDATVQQIRSLDMAVAALSDAGLAERITALKHEHQDGKPIEEILPEVFALVRESSRRTTGLIHFDVQLIGGIVLHQGKIAEMKTGEGKTLVATLPLVLNALSGKGAHLVTVNDYLARRDATWMGPIYHKLGLSVGVIQHEQAFLFDPTYESTDESYRCLRPVERREAYGADITYGTNNEFGFDYLRDNMVLRLSDRVQRDLHFSIVDEVDSILIDEARTPLIISAPAEDSSDLYRKVADLMPRLNEDDDYNVDEKLRSVTLTEQGIGHLESWLGVSNLYEQGGLQLVHHIDQALKAHALFKRDKDYVVKEGEVVIVDEFTGRLMVGRRYSEGLHQAIEAKEGVEVKQENRTLATITFQNLFRLYGKLAGMTGTAATEAEEFHKIYKLDVVEIPPNKTVARKDNSDAIFKDETGKFTAVIKEIKQRNEAGQPVLVGTVSIEKNELLSGLLDREGVKHEILNAKNHEREANIIAQAGRAGAVTLATNMAGRGVDIVLGGKPADPAEAAKVKELGGLHVIGTERHESRRIDNQLRGRSGRQGDPGSTRFFVSMDDDLMRIFGGQRMKGLMERLRLPDDMPIENRMISRSIESAQKKVEGHNFDIRKHLVEYDDVINKQREVIYKRRLEILKTSEEQPEKLTELISEYVDGEIAKLVSLHTPGDRPADWDMKEIIETASAFWSVPNNETEQWLTLVKQESNPSRAREQLLESVKEKGHIALTNLAKQINDPSIFIELQKNLLLRTIDTQWVDHLDTIDYLRQGIGLRGYAQQDPLVEYQKESYRLFTQLLDSIQADVVAALFKLGDVKQFGGPLQPRHMIESAPQKEMHRGAGQFARVASESGQAPSPKPQAVSSTTTSTVPNTIFKDGALRTKDGQKIGRNDPCPCGSGKKFKKCHGQ